MICVDASVAVKWIIEEERSGQAMALYDTVLEAGREIVAPPLLPIEVTNILRQRTRSAAQWPLDVAIARLERFLSLPIAIYDPDDLHQRALALAHLLDLPAAYDAHYLALSEHLGCELWTDDARLFRAVQHDLPFVRRLSDYPAPAETEA